MGINGLLLELLGGEIPRTKNGFDSLSPLMQNDKNPTDMYVGTLVHVCTLTHKSTHNDGNYASALREFQRRLTLLASAHR